MKIKSKINLSTTFIFICAVSIVFYFSASNFALINSNVFQRLLNAQSGPLVIEGQCFVLDTPAYGVKQWGNGVYYYSSAIMYLLRKGATGVFMSSGADDNGRTKNPIGIPHLDGVGFGPNVSAVNKSDCINVNPKYIGRNKRGIKEGRTSPSSMQDLMDFREEWDDMKKDWPSAPYNPNLVSDFGVEPPIQEVMKRLGVEWSDVVVVHIRQGDVMWRANKLGDKMFGHSQPPCAFYEDVIETGYDGAPFPFLLIITNKVIEPVQINPCDMFLDDKYRSRQYATKLLDYDMIVNRIDTVESHAGAPGENEGMRKDLHLLSEAVNVAEGHSTFTMGTTLMNYNLKRHFFVANPSTINSIAQAMETLEGNWVHTRHFYMPGIQQTQYILNKWLGHDATCQLFFDRSKANMPLGYFINLVGTQSQKWDAEGTNFTNFALAYERSSMMKINTSNNPFQCDSVPFMKNNSNWFIPCICNDTK